MTSTVCHTVEVVKDNENQKGYNRPATPYVDSDTAPCENADSEDPTQQSIDTQKSDQPQTFHLTFIRGKGDEGGSIGSSAGEANSSSSLSSVDSSDDERARQNLREYPSPTQSLTPNTSLSSMSSTGTEPGRKGASRRHHHRRSTSSALPIPIKPALKSPTRPQSHLLQKTTTGSGPQSPTSPKMVSWAEMLNVCVFESYNDGKDEMWHECVEELPSTSLPFYEEAEDDPPSLSKANDNIHSLLEFYQSPESTIALRHNRSHCDVRNLFSDDGCCTAPLTMGDDACDMEVQLINSTGSVGIDTAMALHGGVDNATSSKASLQANDDFTSLNAGKPLPSRPSHKRGSRPLYTPPPAKSPPTPTLSLSSQQSCARKPVRRVSVKSPEVYERLTNSQQATSGRSTPLSMPPVPSWSDSLASPSRSATPCTAPPSGKAQQHPVVSAHIVSAAPTTVAAPPVPCPPIPSIYSTASAHSTMPSILSPTSLSTSWLSKIFRPATSNGTASKASRSRLLSSRLSMRSQSPQSDRPSPAPLDISAASSEGTGEQKTIKSPTFIQLLSPTARLSQLKAAISGSFSGTLRSPLFSPKSQASASLPAMASRLAKAEDAEAIPQLPPREDDGPRNIPIRPLPKVPSIAASARRQSTRSPQLYPDDATDGPLSLTYAASMVIDGFRPESRCHSRAESQRGHATDSGRSTAVAAVAAQPDPSEESRLKSPTVSHAFIGKSEVRQQDDDGDDENGGGSGVCSNSSNTSKPNAPLSPEKRRRLSQTISGRPLTTPMSCDREHLVRTVQMTSGRDCLRATISADSRKALPTPRSSPSERAGPMQGYDRHALERIIPNRPATPSWQYVHAVSHQVGTLPDERSHRSSFAEQIMAEIEGIASGCR
ncbi:hypothetical protein DFQ26_007882, partial [Actinomortierella ambigua]